MQDVTFSQVNTEMLLLFSPSDEITNVSNSQNIALTTLLPTEIFIKADGMAEGGERLLSFALRHINSNLMYEIYFQQILGN